MTWYVVKIRKGKENKENRKTRIMIRRRTDGNNEIENGQTESFVGGSQNMCIGHRPSGPSLGRRIASLAGSS